MKADKLEKVLLVLYLLYSLYFVVANFAILDMYDVIGLVFGLLLICFLKKRKLNSKTLIVCFILALIIRSCLIFIPYKSLESDYQFFNNNAVLFSKGKTVNNAYISLFPYLYFYVVFLGSFFKLFGSGYSSVVIFNMFIELIGVIFLYLLTKSKYSQKVANKATVFYLINPLSFLWIVKCCPVIVVNTLLIIIFYFFEKISNSSKTRFVVLYSIIMGIVMSIANNIRPIIIILIIALLCNIVLKIICKRKDVKKSVISFIAIIIPYLILNTLFSSIISNNIKYDLPKNPGGWSIYVGANYKYNGRWNFKDSESFSQVVSQKGNVKAHQIMQNKGIQRYKVLGLKSIILLLKKSVILSGAVPSNTHAESIDFIDIRINPVINCLVKVYIYSYMFILLLLNLYTIYKHIKRKEVHDFLYIIFIIGLFTSMLLVEVSERYFLPIIIPIVIYGLDYFNNEEN